MARDLLGERRAISTVIGPIAGPAGVLDALGVLARDHAQAPLTPQLARSFAARLIAEFGWPVTIDALAEQLRAALSGLEASRPVMAGEAARTGPRSPGLADTGTAGVAVALPAARSPRAATLSLLLDRLASAAARAVRLDRDELAQRFFAQCAETIGRAAADDAAEVVGGRRPALAGDIAQDAAVLAVNALYLVLLDVLGPVPADRLLAGTVRAIEQAADFDAFPVRSLL